MVEDGEGKMKAIFFVVILWMHDNNFHTTVVHVPMCPSKSTVEETYERLLAQGKFKAWSALCTTVDFSRPITPKPDMKKKKDPEKKDPEKEEVPLRV